MVVHNKNNKPLPDKAHEFEPTPAFIKKAITLVKDYLSENDWRVKENSNTGFSIQGLNSHITTYVSALHWLYEVYNEDIRNAHVHGEMHIHDLGYLTAYCCGWSLQDLLLKGFGGVRGKITSRPAKHFRAALGQIWNFMYSMQGEAAGAQAFSSFDTYLAPFIKYDKLNYDQVKQAMEEFIYNMNIPTRAGFQTPFTNITMDLQCNNIMKNEPVIYAGKYHTTDTYGMFQKEMNMINKAFCEIMMKGDANQRIFTFPIPTYNITKDFDWDDKNLKPLWEMTSKYGIPYFANFINSDMSPESVRSMCCRLRIDNRELHKRGGGLFGSNPLTGSVGVVTINLPRLGYQSQSKIDFFERLEKIMYLAKDSLLIKRKVIEKMTDNGVYPYIKEYLKDIKNKQGSYWANHFNTIGIIGMNELCLNRLNKPISHPDGKEFSLEVLDFMRSKLLKYQTETNLMWNLEATPAEGTSYRLAKKDAEKYKNIVTAGDKENPYYTNSSQLPVDYTDDLFEALTHQDELQCKYTGGTVFHAFLGEKIDDWRACRSLVRKITENFKMPYLSITPTFSICPEHGYISGEHHTCPKCI